MALSESLIMELEQEAVATRRVLERVPEDKFDWRPHPKSWSLGQLALHVAQIPGSVPELARETVSAPPRFEQQAPDSKEELLRTQEESIRSGRAALEGWSDDDMREEWRLEVDGEVKMAMPRLSLLRTVMFNHLYHHRGQLLVYLRLAGEKVPAVYGTSADENPLA